MTPVAEGQDTYLAELERFANGRGEVAPAWLKDLRAGGRAAFEQIGFPTTRQEEWRFTNVSPIATTPFRLAEGVPTNAAPLVSRVAVRGSVRLVLLNGRFAPELSDLSTVPVGLKIGSLAAAIASGAPECPLLGQQPARGPALRGAEHRLSGGRGARLDPARAPSSTPPCTSSSSPAVPGGR